MLKNSIQHGYAQYIDPLEGSIESHAAFKLAVDISTVIINTSIPNIELTAIPRNVPLEGTS